MTENSAPRPSARQRITPSLLVVFGLCNLVGGGALAWFEQHEFDQRIVRAKEADASLAEFNLAMQEKFAEGGISIVNTATSRPTEVRPADFTLAWLVAGCGVVCTSMGFILSARNQSLVKNTGEAKAD